MPVGEAVAIILQVLDGLTYTHNGEISNVRLADGSFAKRRGLIHRDLKPGNIFLRMWVANKLQKLGIMGYQKLLTKRV